MPARTPKERSLLAEIAAHTSWARTENRTARTAPARAGLRAKFAREVDPNGSLTPAERARRVDSMMRAHMLRMTRAAAAARAAKKPVGVSPEAA